MPLKIRNAAEHLIDIASDLFAKYGYNNVSVRQIAKASDLNIASISYYFGSKEALYLNCCEQLINYLLEQVDAFNETDYPNAKARLDAYLKQRITTYLDPRACILFNFYLREKLTPTKAYPLIINATDHLAKQSYTLFKKAFISLDDQKVLSKHLGLSGYLLLLVTSKEKLFNELHIKNDTQAIDIIFNQINYLFLS